MKQTHDVGRSLRCTPHMPAQRRLTQLWKFLAEELLWDMCLQSLQSRQVYSASPLQRFLANQRFQTAQICVIHATFKFMISTNHRDKLEKATTYTPSIQILQTVDLSAVCYGVFVIFSHPFNKQRCKFIIILHDWLPTCKRAPAAVVGHAEDALGNGLVRQQPVHTPLPQRESEASLGEHLPLIAKKTCLDKQCTHQKQLERPIQASYMTMFCNFSVIRGSTSFRSAKAALPSPAPNW